MPPEFNEFLEWEEDNNGYWSEDRWEKELLKNEKMVEKYKKILEESPDSEWHYSVDNKFRENVGGGCEAPLTFPESENWEAPEDIFTEEEVEDLEDNSEDFYNELEEIKAYCIACDFASEIYEYVRNMETPPILRDRLEALLINSMKISANIAGGHGLGYEKETICGNIVKNKWAIKSLEKAIQSLDAIIFDEGPNERLFELCRQAEYVKKAVNERIKTLRKQVWW